MVSPNRIKRLFHYSALYDDGRYCWELADSPFLLKAVAIILSYFAVDTPMRIREPWVKEFGLITTCELRHAVLICWLIVWRSFGSSDISPVSSLSVTADGSCSSLRLRCSACLCGPCPSPSSCTMQASLDVHHTLANNVPQLDAVGLWTSAF